LDFIVVTIKIASCFSEGNYYYLLVSRASSSSSFVAQSSWINGFYGTFLIVKLRSITVRRLLEEMEKKFQASLRC